MPDGKRNDGNLVCSIDRKLFLVLASFLVNRPGTRQTPDVQTKHLIRQTPEKQSIVSDRLRKNQASYQTDAGKTKHFIRQTPDVQTRHGNKFPVELRKIPKMGYETMIAGF